jgi:hypothetical protein
MRHVTRASITEDRPIGRFGERYDSLTQRGNTDTQRLRVRQCKHRSEAGCSPRIEILRVHAMAAHHSRKRNYPPAGKRVAYNQTAWTILANSIDNRSIYRFCASGPPTVGAYRRQMDLTVTDFTTHSLANNFGI